MTELVPRDDIPDDEDALLRDNQAEFGQQIVATLSH